jgi:uncharacterized phage protein (TIGR01671 family)
MREILFRGKRCKDGEWVVGSYYKQKEFYGTPFESHVIITSTDDLEYDQALEFHCVQPETVGQFTGLTDNNGMKIFEGDIVSDYGPYCEVVEFTTEGVASCGCCFAYFEGSGFKARNTDLKDCTISGNIHDNPELAKNG